VAAFTADPSSGVAAARRGTYAGLAERAEHLANLGVTAVELLPVHAFDPQDAPAGRINYWGYSSVSFFAPHPGFAVATDPLAVLDEFRDMVRALHAAGLRVILDVVYNHTAEAGADGPVLCWRGFDEAAYYMQDEMLSRYRDFTGCGNTFNANHPVAGRLISDSLRHWIANLHVDGFRFDLAAALARDPDGEPLARPPVLLAVDTDPALAGTRLIAEAWDIGGLHLVGEFPGRRFAAWNGYYRDTVRRFLKGDDGTVEQLMARIVGSPDVFGRRNDLPSHSINFVTCHDGFTLRDLVTYEQKHNRENGEENRDGSNANLSWHSGLEGPSKDPAVTALRERRVRNFLVLLFFSHGTPMLLAGDEWGQTRAGNNNPWCQDNERNWLDWKQETAEAGLLRFVRLVADLANHLPQLATDRFWRASSPEVEGDITWHGMLPNRPDWTAKSHHLAYELIPRSGTGRVLVLLNAEPDTREFTLPAAPAGTAWHLVVDTGAPSPHDFRDVPVLPVTPVRLPTHTVMVLRALPPDGGSG
jgi:glycogen operon protein